MAPVTLRLRPISLGEARRYVAEHHRHNDPPIGHRFSVAVEDGEGALRGVGIAGRPIARHADDGRTIEVVRVCTDGATNACSLIYGALVRASWALGYGRVITYTLASESGASLRASGFVEDGRIAAHDGWKHTSGPRALDRPQLWGAAKMPTGDKVRWVRVRAG